MDFYLFIFWIKIHQPKRLLTHPLDSFLLGRKLLLKIWMVANSIFRLRIINNNKKIYFYRKKSKSCKYLMILGLKLSCQLKKKRGGGSTDLNRIKLVEPKRKTIKLSQQNRQLSKLRLWKSFHEIIVSTQRKLEPFTWNFTLYLLNLESKNCADQFKFQTCLNINSVPIKKGFYCFKKALIIVLVKFWDWLQC